MLRMAFGSNAYVNLEYTNKRTGENYHYYLCTSFFLHNGKLRYSSQIYDWLRISQPISAHTCNILDISAYCRKRAQYLWICFGFNYIFYKHECYSGTWLQIIIHLLRNNWAYNYNNWDATNHSHLAPHKLILTLN